MSSTHILRVCICALVVATTGAQQYPPTGYGQGVQQPVVGQAPYPPPARFAQSPFTGHETPKQFGLAYSTAVPSPSYDATTRAPAYGQSQPAPAPSAPIYPGAVPRPVYGGVPQGPPVLLRPVARSSLPDADSASDVGPVVLPTADSGVQQQEDSSVLLIQRLLAITNGQQQDDSVTASVKSADVPALSPPDQSSVQPRRAVDTSLVHGEVDKLLPVSVNSDAGTPLQTPDQRLQVRDAEGVLRNANGTRSKFASEGQCTVDTNKWCVLVNTALGEASMYFRQTQFAGCDQCLQKCAADNAAAGKYKCQAVVFDHREKTCDLFAVSANACQGTASSRFVPVLFQGADYFEVLQTAKGP